MPHSDPNKHAIPRPRQHRLPRKPMRHILQSDAGAPALDPQRQHAVHKRVAEDERQQEVAEGGGAAERGPPVPIAMGAVVGRAVAEARLAAAVEAQREAGDDVCGEREGDDEGLGEGGLVVRACEEEVGV